MEPQKSVHRLADVDLTEEGVEEANTAGRKLKAKGVRFDVGFTSALMRAQRSLDLILGEIGHGRARSSRTRPQRARLGDLSGLNKDEARAKWGDEQVHIWRRSYDRATGRREPAGHRGAGLSLLHPGNPAGSAPRRTRPDRRSRQFAPGPHHGARRNSPQEVVERESAPGYPWSIGSIQIRRWPRSATSQRSAACKADQRKRDPLRLDQRDRRGTPQLRLNPASTFAAFPATMSPVRRRAAGPSVPDPTPGRRDKPPQAVVAMILSRPETLGGTACDPGRRLGLQGRISGQALRHATTSDRRISASGTRRHEFLPPFSCFPRHTGAIFADRNPFPALIPLD